LTPFIWFLDRAAEGGIRLTASGYLKPADVTAAAEVLPTMHGWIGQASREVDTTPVLHFRKALQGLGLLRKNKGSLLLTRAGHDSHAAWQTLWNQLADRLVPNTDAFDTDATLLLLLYAATSLDGELPLDTIAAALTHLGWRSNDGTPIVGYDLYPLRALDVLRNVSTAHVSRSGHWRVGDAVAELARRSAATTVTPPRGAIRRQACGQFAGGASASLDLRRAMYPIGSVAGPIEHVAACVPERNIQGAAVTKRCNVPGRDHGLVRLGVHTRGARSRIQGGEDCARPAARGSRARGRGRSPLLGRA
jgi:hypothetical protein